MLIATGPWLPDLADLGNPGSTVATNVVPVSPTDYGPFPSFVQGQQNALDGRVLGAQTFEAQDGTSYVFAGTADKIYMLHGLGATWTDVTPSGGVSVAGNWYFVQYEQRIIATNFNKSGGSVLLTYVIGVSSAFAALTPASPYAPQAAFIDMVKVFLMAAFTYDAVGLNGPYRVWWSCAGDPTTWPTPGSNTAQADQSSYVDLAGDMGAITGLVGNLGNADVAVFFERGIWSGQYAGPPTVFNFTPIEGARGTKTSASIIRYGGVTYYLGLDGFYSFDGVNSSPIGAGMVDQWFFKNAAGNYATQMCGAVDIPGRCVVWSFPTTNAPAANNDACLVYHVVFQRWSLVYMPLQWVLRAIATAATIDDIDSLFGYAGIDSIPISLDSPVFSQPSSLLFAGFNGTNNFGLLNGPPLAATVTTTEMRPNPGGRAFLRSARPLIDGAASAVSLISRNNESDTPLVKASSVPNSMGECPMRADARFMRFQVATAYGTQFSHLHGVDADLVPAGWR